MIDVVYAALMPWMKGELWQEIILTRRKFSPELSQALAHALVRDLAVMEQQQIAHCDLSGGNIMVVRTQGEVALIDVEDLYAPHLTRPTQLPGGSPGYAHREAPAGLWRAESDRFAGLVLLGEMLCWFDPRVRQESYGEYFFDPQEMQRESARLELLREVLGGRWGTAVLEAFERGWFSQKLNDCPSFQDWRRRSMSPCRASRRSRQRLSQLRRRSRKRTICSARRTVCWSLDRSTKRLPNSNRHTGWHRT